LQVSSAASLVELALLLDEPSQVLEPFVVEVRAAVGFVEGVGQFLRIADALIEAALHQTDFLIHKLAEGFDSLLALAIAAAVVAVVGAAASAFEFAFVDFVVEDCVVILHGLHELLLVLGPIGGEPALDILLRDGPPGLDCLEAVLRASGGGVEDVLGLGEEGHCGINWFTLILT
jgi:hypothetical protein